MTEAHTTYSHSLEMISLVEKRKELRLERQNMRDHIEQLKRKVERTTGKLEMLQETMEQVRFMEMQDTNTQDTNTLPGLEPDEGEDG